MPNTSAPSFAAGNAVVPSPQPRSSTLSPFVIPSRCTSASPLSRIVSAMRVKSPFSQSALFGLAGAFINVTLSLASRSRNLLWGAHAAARVRFGCQPKRLFCSGGCVSRNLQRRSVDRAEIPVALTRDFDVLLDLRAHDCKAESHHLVPRKNSERKVRQESCIQLTSVTCSSTPVFSSALEKEVTGFTTKKESSNL